jgi:hypothetical protein
MWVLLWALSSTQTPIQTSSRPETEIILRCSTTADKSLGKVRSQTQGRFTLSLIPSEVSPEDYADAQIMSLDPDHDTTLKQTTCFTYRCSVKLTPGFYEIYSQFRKKDALKITLNRQTGAFYGHQYASPKLLQGFNTAPLIIEERGTCTPVPKAQNLF